MKKDNSSIHKQHKGSSLNDVITREAAKNALLRSGYLLENRIESILRQNEYYVTANSAYPDPLINKPRELDIDAIYATSVYKDEFIYTNLLIECINNPQPIVFITKNPIYSFLHGYDIKLSGLPSKIYNPKDNYWDDLSAYLKMDEYHHYCSGKIATQFCSFSKKKSSSKDEWMAMHDDEHFNDFQKLANVVDYKMKQHFDSFKNRDFQDQDLDLFFYSPVLVVQGQLWEAIPSIKSVSFRKAEHLQYRYSTISNNKEITYHIDVVTERFFPKYLQLIQNEINTTKVRFKRHRSVVKDSVVKLIDSIKIKKNDAISVQSIIKNI